MGQCTLRPNQLFQMDGLGVRDCSIFGLKEPGATSGSFANAIHAPQGAGTGCLGVSNASTFDPHTTSPLGLPMGLPIQWGVVVVPASMSASSMAEVDGVFGKCRSAQEC